nr:MAG TPA: hypothetical protein [Caudoviricetes sp.]
MLFNRWAVFHGIAHTFIQSPKFLLGHRRRSETERKNCCK